MNRTYSFLSACVLAIAASASLAAAEDAVKPAKPPAVHHAAVTPESVKKAPMPKINLNTATEEELAKLPGVDEALAQKILAGRPYKTRKELVSKQIMPEANYVKIKSMVFVPMPAAAPAKTVKKG